MTYLPKIVLVCAIRHRKFVIHHNLENYFDLTNRYENNLYTLHLSFLKLTSFTKNELFINRRTPSSTTSRP